MNAPILVKSTDGTDIAVWRGGAGPPLVLVHGTTADHTRWARVLPLFEAHFTVHAMDRRGRGGSGDAERYSLEQEGADVAAVVASLDEPVTLLGHSYGGLCALEAATRTTCVWRLVLYDPPLPGGAQIVPPATRDRIDAHLARGEREAALLTFFREVVHVPEPQIEMLRAHPAWPGRIAAAHTLAREMRVEEEYRFDFDRLRGVRCPTLFLLGGDSPPFLQDATRRLHAALPGSRIQEMPGQQHVAMDTIPEEFVGFVTQFAEGAPA
jgi:pimeloyl-ACP methyl ester carboxylesterase